MSRSASRPSRQLRAVFEVCLLSCLSVAAVTSHGARGADSPGLVAVSLPLRKVLVFTNAVNEYNEGQSRLLNLLDGMGLDFDLKSFGEAARTNVAGYQLVIVAPWSEAEMKVPRPLERGIIDAIARGTNVLWVGGGIWGTFTSTDLPETFGLRYVGEGWSTEARVSRAGFVNLAGKPDRLTVHKENLYRVEAVKADTEAWYLDASGEPLKLPFITRYRPGKGSGQAVYLALQLLTYWKFEEADDTFARAEVLQRYIRQLTPEGSVGKHSARDGHEAVFLLRLEDYVPGGTQMGHTERLWLIRMERLLELCRRHALPLNIALVPIYRDPFRDEHHRWDDADAVIATLRRQASRAFDAGGSLVVHGYAHQYGSGPSNFSGSDWEVWDNAGQRFLPLAEQKAITANAYAEVVKQFGIRPAVWETPHYVGNTDTARAATAAGFRFFTESDTKLFPNRQGYLNRLQGLVLNVPETAFNYPSDPDEVKRSGLFKQQSLMPRLARMNGLFYVFYHNASRYQERALENLLTEMQRFDFWKPNLEEYAQFWEKRDRARVKSLIDPAGRRLIADVAESFRGLTLSARLPDGATPESVTLDGKPAEARWRHIDGAWYVYPVLPDAKHCRVVIGFRQAPPGR